MDGKRVLGGLLTGLGSHYNNKAKDLREQRLMEIQHGNRLSEINYQSGIQHTNRMDEINARAKLDMNRQKYADANASSLFDKKAAHDMNITQVKANQGLLAGVNKAWAKDAESAKALATDDMGNFDQATFDRIMVGRGHNPTYNMGKGPGGGAIDVDRAQSMAEDEANAQAGWLSSDKEDFSKDGGNRAAFINRRTQEIMGGKQPSSKSQQFDVKSEEGQYPMITRSTKPEDLQVGGVCTVLPDGRLGKWDGKQFMPLDGAPQQGSSKKPDQFDVSATRQEEPLIKPNEFELQTLKQRAALGDQEAQTRLLSLQVAGLLPSEDVSDEEVFRINKDKDALR